MKFEDVIAHLRNGGAVRRAVWEKNELVCIKTLDYFRTVELTADDWEIVEEEKPKLKGWTRKGQVFIGNEESDEIMIKHKWVRAEWLDEK